jgi:DNA polymerase
MAYAVNDESVKLWLPGDTIPSEFKNFNGCYVARNAKFEYAICEKILCKKYNFPKRLLNTQHWIDTVNLSYLAGIPGNLEGCAEVVNKKFKKLKSGEDLINKYSKPYKGAFREFTGCDWEKMIIYNRQDVEADRESFYILLKLPNVKYEIPVMQLDMKQNIKGLKIDVPILEKTLNRWHVVKDEAEKRQEELNINVRSPDQLKEFCSNEGHTIPNAQKETIEALLLRDITPELREILSLRQLLSKSSVSKFTALQNMTSNDGRIRNFIQYHGAHTGRWAGRGFQPHNLPKTKTNIEKINIAIKNLEQTTGQDFIKSAQTILPALVIPDPGYTFLLGDFKAVEARGIAWLAGETKLLTQFKAGIDTYVEMAATIYRKNASSVTSAERDTGKTTILSCGFGQGANGFYKKNINILTSHEQAAYIVSTYRETFTKIKQFWYDLMNTFSYLCNHRGTQTVRHLVLRREKNYITIQLPSGRLMYYHKPRKVGRDIIYYNHLQGRDVYIWYGILAENVTQALCRDIFANRLVEADKLDLSPIMHTHDEIVCMVKKTEVEEKEKIFKNIMNTAPTWCRDFPLETEIEISERYHK